MNTPDKKLLIIRDDFENLLSGTNITLYPSKENLLYQSPHKAYYDGKFFYCEDSDSHDGPDYYIGDVLRYNDGYCL